MKNKNVFRHIHEGELDTTYNGSSNVLNIGVLQINLFKILNKLKQLKDDKQPRFDGVALILLKKCADLVAVVLEYTREGFFLKFSEIYFLNSGFKVGLKK